MKLLIFCVMISSSFAQSIQSIHDMKAPTKFDNIHKIDLASDENSSSFLIFVKKEVKAHIHAKHTETVYVLEGEADFYLNDAWKKIKAGDIIIIPKNTIHAVKVTSKQMMKVISVQSPKFIGKDRIFKEIE